MAEVLLHVRFLDLRRRGEAGAQGMAEGEPPLEARDMLAVLMTRVSPTIQPRDAAPEDRFRELGVLETWLRIRGALETLSQCGGPMRGKHVVDKLSRGLAEAEGKCTGTRKLSGN
jgi:hypothetical protein